ncbi:MAG: septation protein A [Candidimonas sp.]|nr:MAG: septation protein A [Candidimonas sp.]
MKKFLFDLFPLILFFVAFKFSDIYGATTVAIIAAVAQFVWLKARHKPIEATHWINLTVITLFGGATLFFHNDVFIKWKPTVLYWVFAGILLGGKWLFRRNLLEKIMGAQVSMPAVAWDKMMFGWAGFFVVCGLLNLYVAFSGYFTEAQWVNFKVFGLMALLLVFAVAQSLWLHRYLVDDTAKTPQPDSEGRSS